MIMKPLAWLAGQLMGPWLKGLVLPAMIVAALTGWHQWTKAKAEASTAREAAAVLRGKRECLSEVRLAQVEAELATERARAQTALDEAESARRVTLEIEGHVRTLEVELSRRSEATAPVANANPGCYSDGVLNAIRQGDRRSGAGGSPGRGGSAAQPTGKAP